MMRASSLLDTPLLTRWHDARVETDALFGIVRPEFLFERPVAERHRLAFYIGHLEAFDWNLLGGHLGLASERPDLDRLFAFGIDPVGGKLPQDQPGDWPALSVFHAYRDRVRARLDDAIADRRADDGERQLEQCLHVAIEHRQMHAETLAYLLHRLPFDDKTDAASVAPRSIRDITASTLTIQAGTTVLGMRRDAGEFGWDNEFDAHAVEVPEFAIDRYKITNAQYLGFVDAGGYADRRWWTDDDWRWRCAHAITHPAFWIRSDGKWFWRSMFAQIPLPLAFPVYVSHAEARAYAAWAGRSLPTEAQWQRAAFGTNTDPPNPIERTPRAVTRGDAFDPLPVDDANLAASPFGVVGMRANGWEWTASPFAAFRGFHPFDFYANYSEPFFDGRHFVLKGGSVRTAATMLRPSFRNWFQPHYPYVYAGFRCVDSLIGHAPRSTT